MSEEPISLKEPRRVPAWLWLALLPAVLIGLNQIRKGGRERVEFAGAGLVHLIDSDDAPDDLRYYPETRRHASLAEARASIVEGLRIQPSVFVFSLDLEAWEPAETSQDELQDLYIELHRRASSAATVPVVIGPWLPETAPADRRAAIDEVSGWWRRGPCQRAKALLCVDVSGLSSEADLRAAIQAGVRSGARRLAGFRASTQRGR